MFTLTWSSVMSRAFDMSWYDMPSKSLSCMQVRSFSGMCDMSSATIFMPSFTKMRS